MKAPVLVLTRNTLEITKRCINSICNQDVPVSLFVIDNGSTDGTEEWLSSDAFTGVWQRFDPQIGVSKGWNHGLKKFFYDPIWNKDRAFVLNSDAVLPPYFIRAILHEMDQRGLGFLTGNGTADLPLPEVLTPQEPVEAPDFSCFCISREVWEKVGPFDLNLFLYCGDLDYHLRAHRKGIHLWNSGIPYHHERSSTLNNADPKEKRWIQLRADADRAVFQRKWGQAALTSGYEALFDAKYFGVEKEEANAIS